MGEEAENKDKDKDTLPRDQLGNGPILDRSCTDILCCLIFIAFLVGMVGACGYGYLYGNPALLTTTWDGDGRGCGYSPATLDYPYLYFPMIDPTKANEAIKEGQNAQDEDAAKSAATKAIQALMKYGTCVKECPRYNPNDTSEFPPPQCKQLKSMLDAEGTKTWDSNCVYYFSKSQNQFFRYDTQLVGGKFCLPSTEALESIGEEVVGKFQEEFAKLFGDKGIMQYINDIIATKNVLLIALGTAFLVGFVYMIVLRIAGGPIIYLSLLALILASAGGGFMLFQKSQEMKGSTLKQDIEQQQYYEIGSYIVWGFSALILCCTICNWKNIKIGVAVMKCTAQFIGGTPQVFIVPPIAIVFLMVWLAVWLIMTLYIFSVGEVKPMEEIPALSTVEWSEETRYVFLYTLFGYLWLNAFMIGVTQFIICAACALWYFSCTSDSNGSGSLVRGLYWVFRYHLGSIAFGAFLIALVQFIRIIFEYYKNQIQKANKDSKIVKALLCMTSYLLDCLERFIKFISKNAYIQMAITGKNFCASAWNAFCLLLKNAMRFGTAATIGTIFSVLGVCFIAAANGCVVYAFLHYVPAFQGLTQNWIAPVAVGMVQGIVIGAMFMSIFSFSSDTILQCFLVDEELNRPDGMRPAIMNQFIEGVEDKKEEPKE